MFFATIVIMYQSNWSFNIPPPGKPPGICTFNQWLVQIFSPRGKKVVQMPQQLVLKYLFSKTNFAFNQTLFKLFRVRYAVNDTFKLLLKTLWQSYSLTWLTKAKFYLGNPSNPTKTEKTHGHITLEQEINLVQIPHPSKATFKFPPPRARTTVKCPGYARGGCWSFNLTGT